jgi:hypothetical protein
MASLFQDIERRVIPNWRSYQDTCAIGELGFYNLRPIANQIFTLDEYVNDWKDNRDVLFAGELISAAVSNDQMELEEVTDAAEFILTHKDKASTVQIKLAGCVFRDAEKTQNEIVNDGLLDKLLGTEKTIGDIILLKERIRLYPYNPILYVEIARCYLLLGQINKAKRMMSIARQLGTHNRYVTRSAARFYLDIGDIDVAHEVVIRNEMVKEDPWLLASEISISLVRERFSKYIKKSAGLLNSSQFDAFSLSELASTLGTVELLDGSKKRSRDYFKQALVLPNDNSFAQAEWAKAHSIPLDITGAKSKQVQRNYEAQCLYKYYTDQYEDALQESVVWLYDMPFSQNAALLGSEVAYLHLKKYNLAEKIMKIGLKCRPKDVVLLNNLAYCYARDNKLDEAEELLNVIDSLKKDEKRKSTEACSKATRGLVAFRRKNIEEGRRLYLEAARMTKEEGLSIDFNQNALLNFFREELLASEGNMAVEDLTFIENYVNSIKEEPVQKFITALKNDVMALLKNRTIEIGKKD